MFYPVLIGIFFMVDLLIFKFFNDSILTFKSYFWLTHFLTIFLFLLIEKKFRKNEGGEIFLLFFPCIGYLMLLLEYFIRIKSNIHSELEEHISYEKYLEEMEKEIIVQSSVDLNLLGAYDILSVGNSKEKKDFLIGFETSNINFKIEVLKKALWDSDIDVIHYAATEINKIDEKFQSEIQKYKKENNKEKLCKTYFNYAISGLLEGAVLNFYQNIILKLLKSKSSLTLEEQYMKLVTCKNLKKYNEFEDVANILLKEKWLPEHIVDFIKEFYYEENELGKVKEVEQWQKFV